VSRPNDEDDRIGGGQVGFNWQVGRWVVGVEAQASWGDLRKGEVWIDPEIDPFRTGGVPAGSKRIGTTVKDFGTVALRVGHAWDRALLYLKGGAAWARDDYRVLNAGVAGEPLLASASNTRWGFMLGLGYEYAFLGNWSAKIEYDYLGFGSETVNLPTAAFPTYSTGASLNVQEVKAGINFKFGP